MRILSRLLLLLGLLNACGGSDSIAPSGGEGPIPGASASPVVGFSRRSVSSGGVTIPYQVFAPQNYVATRKWPIIVALAGTGERGSDGDKQVSVGLGPVVRAQAATFPAVVIFPQVPSDETGRLAFDVAVFQAVDDIVRDYNGDPDRVYLTGLSYGGTEGFTLLYDTPGRFAAFLEIAGGLCARCISNASTLDAAQALVATKLKALPIWIFQGDADQNSPVANTRNLVNAFKAAGSTSLKYTEYPNAGHLIWDTVYGTPAVWDWLLAQRR